MEHPGVSDDAAARRPGSARYLLVSTVAFLSELALLVTLGIAGWHAGGGGLLSVAMTALGPALAVLIWSVWVAPTAARRLADPGRLILQIVLFVVTGVLVALAGRPVLGAVVAVVGVAAFAAARTVEEAHDPAGRHTG
jgi:uncharacterized protein DUF2568